MVFYEKLDRIVYKRTAQKYLQFSADSEKKSKYNYNLLQLRWHCIDFDVVNTRTHIPIQLAMCETKKVHEKLKYLKFPSDASNFFSWPLSDPSEWNGEHIESWLKWCTQQFELWPIPRASDFPQSGNELCSFDRDAFERCTRNRRTARLLFVHLSHLKNALTGRPLSPSLVKATEEKGKILNFFFLNRWSLNHPVSVVTPFEKINSLVLRYKTNCINQTSEALLRSFALKSQ